MPGLQRLVVDCYSADSALRSLAKLLRRSESALRGTLEGFVLRSSAGRSPEDQILGALGFDTKEELPVPDGVRWFHATRVRPGTLFVDGLLPTDKILSRIWSDLGTVASRWTSPEEWRDFRSSFDKGDRHFSRQFRRKRIAVGWAGPFAFLVRDAALGRHHGHRSFVSLGEAAEDIVHDYEEQFGHALKAAYQAETQPCIVSFISPESRPSWVRSALVYAHCCAHRAEEFTPGANYSGEGSAVPAEWITGVEWPDIVAG